MKSYVTMRVCGHVSRPEAMNLSPPTLEVPRGVRNLPSALRSRSCVGGPGSALAPWRFLLPLLVLVALAGLPAAAGTAVGDAGHYLTAQTKVFLNNPQGKAFHLTLYRFQWWIGDGWNRPEFKVKLTAPNQQVLLDKTCKVTDDGYKINVSAGNPGVYTLDVDPGGTLNYWYMTSSLAQSVAWTGPLEGDAVKSRWFIGNPFVPRRWYFWVPKGCKNFAVRSQNSSGRSQREDHGLTIFSPRGQRMAVLWGQANADAPQVQLGKVKRRIQKAEVLVEPGSTGRFWAIEIRMGDSHTYSDVSVNLEGVPPYLARSPEEWFDAKTGKKAPVELYDETEFVQSDRTKKGQAKDPLIHHWTPCPALGDPDANEIRCPAKIALWNPENRPLRFVIGTYLPRNMFPSPEQKKKHGWTSLPEKEHDHAKLRIVAKKTGKKILEANAPLLHLHGHERWVRNLETGKGVAIMDVTKAEHFWMYTYPATPLVMIGQKVGTGWHCFKLEAGTARNWYFYVPRQTKQFFLRASAADHTDVMRLEVGAPDRVVAMIFGNKGKLTVKVPAGMAGKIWHVRLDFGGATRFISRLPGPRFPSMNISLALKGVPGYLAPTWEQWFDPKNPSKRGM